MNPPKIVSVEPLDNYHLLIEFDNKEKKRYNVAPLFSNATFAPLRDNTLFNAVKIDKGGYAVFWNSAIDISEYELWTNGELVQLAELEQ